MDAARALQQRAAVVETHVSTVVLIGDRAYKLKKPVRFSFLDLTTREAREGACRAEVDLNRRLAPDVYLGVADVVAEDGVPCDHLVVMRRMPDDRRLATLVRERRPIGPGIRQIARTLVAFHARCRTSSLIAQAASPSSVLANWEGNFAEMRPFVGTALETEEARRVEELARSYLAGRRPLLERRMRDGLVIDGHGDLQADDIYLLDDGPRILDCLEFDERLRCGDVLADVAFLAMDLERLGGAPLARRLWRWYLEFSGESHPRSLAEHYTAYRAHVRAKVACLRHSQGDADAAVEARALLGLALRHLEAGRVRMVLVGGPPGTGKSTLARALADRRGWSLFSSDEIRRELWRDEAGSAYSYGEGPYRPAGLRRVYLEMLKRTRTALSLGQSVVLDATWSGSTERQAARRTAISTSSEFAELVCALPLELMLQRVEARAAAGGDLSRASREVALRIKDSFDAWPSATEIDTSGEVRASLQAALRAISR